MNFYCQQLDTLHLQKQIRSFRCFCVFVHESQRQLMKQNRNCLRFLALSDRKVSFPVTSLHPLQKLLSHVCALGNKLLVPILTVSHGKLNTPASVKQTLSQLNGFFKAINNSVFTP